MFDGASVNKWRTVRLTAQFSVAVHISSKLLEVKRKNVVGHELISVVNVFPRNHIKRALSL